MFQNALTLATRTISFHFLIFILSYEREVQFLYFEELLPKFSESKYIWFLYHIPLFLDFYYIVPGEFLGWVLRFYVGGLLSFKIPIIVGRAFFNHLLRMVPAHNALFDKWNVLFSTKNKTKNKKKTCRLGGCSVLNALNLEKRGVQIHSCTLFWYTARMLFFSRISPGWREAVKKFIISKAKLCIFPWWIEKEPFFSRRVLNDDL